MGEKVVAVAEIDRDELTVRLLEIGCGVRRPDGLSGGDALRQIKETAPLKIVSDFEAMAHASIVYVVDQIAAAKRAH